MSTVEDKLQKMREDRLARQNARIEKLKELNLKKYNKTEPVPAIKNVSSKPTDKKPTVKNVLYLNNPAKRPSTAPVPPPTLKIKQNVSVKSKEDLKPIQSDTKIAKIKPYHGEVKKHEGDDKSNNIKPRTSKIDAPKCDKPKISITIPNSLKSSSTSISTDKSHKPSGKIMPLGARKSLAPVASKSMARPLARKSMLPTSVSNPKKPNSNWESVFDRLYKPKTVVTNTNENLESNTKKITMRKSLRPVETKPKMTAPIRRSISAVHLKKINKSELRNCFHKWTSIGNNLNEAHLKEIDEGDNSEKIVSAIKSERKKVKFQTSVHCQTPTHAELQERLQKWLLKRGKSMESFHHLQCFGIHHLAQKQIRPIPFEDAQDMYDDEDKENIAVQSDSDNESYTENMNDRKNDFADDKNSFAADEWRRTSVASSSIAELNDTNTSTLSPSVPVHQADDLLLGALTDLTDLIKEGFDWAQCARWLRAIRERFPAAPSTAAYWECRAALEEGRGNLPLSVHCWEEAIVNGTEQTVVEANLDQLLDKFMQLNISPNSKCKQVDPKLVDVKNVFKSTIIRFAVQQAKLRQSSPKPAFTVTPVRRSGRLSVRERSSVKRSPLRVCASVRQAQRFADKAVFIPNPALLHTP